MACPDLSRLVETCPDLSRLVQTCPDLSRLVQTCPYLSRLVQTCTDLSRLVQTWPIRLFHSTSGPFFKRVIRQYDRGVFFPKTHFFLKSDYSSIEEELLTRFGSLTIFPWSWSLLEEEHSGLKRIKMELVFNQYIHCCI